MDKKIDSHIKMLIKSQEANPNPPIGSILGQKGINIISFCNDFNNKTKNFNKGIILSIIIFIYYDKSYNFIIKYTPTSILIKNLLNIEKGFSDKIKNNNIFINKNQILEIAKLKINDTLSNNIDKVFNSIIGTIKSMGIKIIE